MSDSPLQICGKPLAVSVATGPVEAVKTTGVLIAEQPAEVTLTEYEPAVGAAYEGSVAPLMTLPLYH